jgi:hypothetical protein
MHDDIPSLRDLSDGDEESARIPIFPTPCTNQTLTLVTAALHNPGIDTCYSRPAPNPDETCCLADNPFALELLEPR